MGRRSVLAVVAAIAVLSAVVGWVAGQQIRSPAEIAAEKQAPEPSLITVSVESRVLSQNVVVRGTVKASDATEVKVASASGTSVISRLPLEAGAAVNEGDVVVEVSGRPVIALQGTLPAFRNLIPTLEGPDVKQLEEALTRLGYKPGTVDGRYDAATASAVAALYRDAGYSPPGDAAADREAVKSATDAVTAQQAAVSAARKALDDAKAPLKQSTKLGLDQSVTSAQSTLDKAKADSLSARAAAAKAVTDGEKAVADATTASTKAADQLRQAEAGTNPETGQPPTSVELAGLRSAATAAAKAVTDADTALTAARAAIETTAREQDSLVAQAAGALQLSQVQRDEQLAPADTSPLATQVSEAEKALSTAKTALSEAQAKVGSQLPAAEVLFLPALPREVQTVAVKVGDSPSGAVMTISGADTVVESGVSSADRRLLKVGDQAVLSDENLGISVKALVSFIADSAGGPGLSADRYAMRLEPSETVPDDALNVNLRISIPISSSGGEVMAVPLAALSAGADGSARLEVERTVGQTEVVKVVPGLRAEGFVQVDAAAGAALTVGDRVVVGRDLVLPGAKSGSSSSAKKGSGTTDSTGGSS
jgi:Putative peptidoglycan binding domain